MDAEYFGIRNGNQTKINVGNKWVFQEVAIAKHKNSKLGKQEKLSKTCVLNKSLYMGDKRN